MHLEIKVEGQKKEGGKKKRLNEKDENGEVRKFSVKLGSQFPSARH